MYRIDGAAWLLASLGVTVVEPDPSLAGFIRNASVVGSVIGAGWLVEARIGKKIGSAIESHTAVEEERLKTVRAEFSGAVGTLAAKIDAVHSLLDATNEKLDDRPCAHTTCRK